MMSWVTQSFNCPIKNHQLSPKMTSRTGCSWHMYLLAIELKLAHMSSIKYHNNILCGCVWVGTICFGLFCAFGTKVVGVFVNLSPTPFNIFAFEFGIILVVSFVYLCLKVLVCIENLGTPHHFCTFQYGISVLVCLVHLIWIVLACFDILWSTPVHFCMLGIGIFFVFYAFVT